MPKYKIEVRAVQRFEVVAPTEEQAIDLCLGEGGSEYMVSDDPNDWVVTGVEWDAQAQPTA